MKMFDKQSVSVDMNRRGCSATFTTITQEGEDERTARMNIYGLLVGRRVMKVIKNGIEIIDENDVEDPLHPTQAEAAVISMTHDLEGFDEKLYWIASGLAILYNNDASDDYATDWLIRQIEELTHID
ncbi:hypothetical protein pEaSNUABM56_00028 [Erwinia phage pEa_SNUABM_56]|uniref:Putative metallopeptidase n=1 Tax=Erwinia phage pEp_SNUABM_01 TaxID=2601643 RepID=A0A5J6DAI9_9CAUD|nr:putative metallopeptidase [Erwinia phage pEp_SNUABM_01]QEQ94828.1 putative metallopeptidase [Erwinia phage pEp_SNUABM_01]UYL85073.1 hypothetical protein pEaSNUABM56_00028 [Erwinia phage pEa_SNUABM_56]